MLQPRRVLCCNHGGSYAATTEGFMLQPHNQKCRLGPPRGLQMGSTSYPRAPVVLLPAVVFCVFLFCFLVAQAENILERHGALLGR